MNRVILTINNVVWTITAILCWFYDNPIIDAIVIMTTIICIIDLGIKFRNMNYSIISFGKEYWLDLVFLLPICKMFRACRVIKAGKILKAIDISFDLTEIISNIYSAIKGKSKSKT